MYIPHDSSLAKFKGASCNLSCILWVSSVWLKRTGTGYIISQRDFKAVMGWGTGKAGSSNKCYGALFRSTLQQLNLEYEIWLYSLTSFQERRRWLWKWNLKRSQTGGGLKLSIGNHCSWTLIAREEGRHETSWRYFTRITSHGEVILQMFIPLCTWHVEEDSPRISIINHLIGQTLRRKFLSKTSSVV